jgi:hypothetical protein
VPRRNLRLRRRAPYQAAIRCTSAEPRTVKSELIFKGKDFVFNHHLAVPFRPLAPVPAKSNGKPNLAGNLIIHGDDLHAFKALLPMYAGKIEVVFIDPPYNTGNEGWSIMIMSTVLSYASG